MANTEAATASVADKAPALRQSKSSAMLLQDASEILKGFAETIDKSNWTGKGDNRRQQESFVLSVKPKEITEAVAVMAGKARAVSTKSSREYNPNVAAAVAIFGEAVAMKEYKDVRGDDGKKKPDREPTGKVFKGVDGLLHTHQRFGNFDFRTLHFDRKKIVEIAAGKKDRSDLIESVQKMDHALREHIARQKSAQNRSKGAGVER